ncbi:MAG: recombination mediator RecR [Bacteroidales bacterium]|nr:recombination mediator RecR [Bacteroidales bacterium]
MTSFSSKLLEQIVLELSKLPGIGKRTALRLALYLLQKDRQFGENIGNSIIKLVNDICYCSVCFNISETETCGICANPKRNRSNICIVEDIRDVMAIESTGQYNGLYHILGGKISPMEGIGPDDLTIKQLISRIEKENTEEIILALSSTIEGDTTNFYIYKQVQDFNINISTIARGISVGDDLEFADEITLGRSILNRIPYENTLTD